jgi:hypothetical protein
MTHLLHTQKLSFLLSVHFSLSIFVFPKTKLSCNTVLSFYLSELFLRTCVYTKRRWNYKNYFFLSFSPCVFVSLSLSIQSLIFPNFLFTLKLSLNCCICYPLLYFSFSLNVFLIETLILHLDK